MLKLQVFGLSSGNIRMMYLEEHANAEDMNIARDHNYFPINKWLMRYKSVKCLAAYMHLSLSEQNTRFVYKVIEFSLWHSLCFAIVCVKRKEEGLFLSAQ